MRFFLLCLPLVFLIAPAHAQKVDEDYIEGLEIGCGFGLTEMCDELIEIEEAGKSVSLTLCNRTDERVRVAIANEVGEVRERRYRARGWRVLFTGRMPSFLGVAAEGRRLARAAHSADPCGERERPRMGRHRRDALHTRR